MGGGRGCQLSDLCTKVVSVWEHSQRLTFLGGGRGCQLSDLCTKVVSVWEHSQRLTFLGGGGHSVNFQICV